MKTEAFNQNSMSDSSKEMMEIQALGQQMLQGGNVQEEKDRVNEIMKDAHLHKITPQEGLTKLQNIMSHRQDYH